MFEHGSMVNPLTFEVNSFTSGRCNLDYMAEQIPATLGGRIRKWRKEAGFATQGALAKEIGCTRETVTMWETDKTDSVGGDYIGPLSIALGKSPAMIQKGREAKLTREGSTAPVSPQLEKIREGDAIQSLRIFVGAIATIMASTQPDAGEALLTLVHSAEGAAEFVDRGLGEDLVKAVRRGIALAKARPPSRRHAAS